MQRVKHYQASLRMPKDKYIDKESPSSNFQPTREETVPITIDNIHDINNTFWEEQSVSLHKCYKQGTAYANNSNKKSSVDLLQDLFKLLKTQYKDNSDRVNTVELAFTNLHNNLQIISNLCNEGVDKHCILAIIKGYTLGCLKNYEK